MRFLPFAIALILVGAAGCAGPHRAVLPPIADAPDQVPAGHRVVRTGDLVRVETRSRSVELGEVNAATPDHVVLGRVGNFGYFETTIQADEIVAIELDGGETAGSAAWKVGGILALTAVVFAMGFVFFGSMGGN